MNKDLKKLIEIQDLDREIASFGPKMDKVRVNLVAKEEDRDELLRAKSVVEKERNDSVNNINKNENHLEELAEKLENIVKKAKKAKTDKESRNLALEEDISKEQITFANEEIERLNKVITAKDEIIKDMDKQLAEIDKDIEELEKSTSEEINKIEEEQSKVISKRNKVASDKDVDVEVITFYEKIRKWAKNNSVVPIYKGKACGGCFITLSDRKQSEVAKGDNIITCPHCGRILYKEDA